MGRRIALWEIKLYVRCPYCKKSFDMWEYNFAHNSNIEIGVDKKNVEIECVMCGGLFKADLELRV